MRLAFIWHIIKMTKNMKNLLNNPKAVALTSTALLFASVVWLLNVKKVNSSLEVGLNNEKLRTESLLSEKLILEKDMAKLKDRLASLSGKNSDLEKVVKQTSMKLEAKETEYNKIRKENLSLQQIRKQHQELLTLQKDLEAQIENLSSSFARLQKENGDLNNTVASLEQRNRLLNEELHRAFLANLDNTQMDALQGKGKLTVKARRSNKLVATFDVPADLKNLTFKVIDPSGNPLTHKDGTIASRVITSSDSYVASSSTTLNGVNSKLAKVEMVYLPTKKLNRGTYKVEILNDNLYVGSLQVRLR